MCDAYHKRSFWARIKLTLSSKRLCLSVIKYLTFFFKNILNINELKFLVKNKNIKKNKLFLLIKILSLHFFFISTFQQESTYFSISKLKAYLGENLSPFFKKIYLETNFLLRCFQQFFQCNVATRRCLWKDNRYTRDCPFPVLSY